jgi:hypothetical protein
MCGDAATFAENPEALRCGNVCGKPDVLQSPAKIQHRFGKFSKMLQSAANIQHILAKIRKTLRYPANMQHILEKIRKTL